MLQRYQSHQMLMALNAQLTEQPLAVNKQLIAFLATAPNNVTALHVLAQSYQQLNNPGQAIATFETIQRLAPHDVASKVALAKLYHDSNMQAQGIEWLNQATKLQPERVEYWQLLANYSHQAGQGELSAEALKQAEVIQAFNHELAAAEQAFLSANFPKADQLARRLLHYLPNETRVLRLLAKIARHFRHAEISCAILAKCVAIKPDNQAIALEYAHALLASKKHQAAYEQCVQIVQHAPEIIEVYDVQAATLVALARYDEAIAIYQALINVHPEKALCLLRLGNVLKIVGNADKATECYQQAIILNPSLGEAFWNLANLKTYGFSETDIATMNAALQTGNVDSLNRVLFHFALGKALEDKQQFEKSFEHYRQANTLYSSLRPYRYRSQKESVEAFFTTEYFAEKKPWGHASTAPIFIVGLPRSGSTLVEQILSSHSQVDATMELTEIVSIARELNALNAQGQGQFPQSLTALTGEQIKTLAQRYLDFVAPLRQNAPYFIDKLPNNFHHLGLIKTLFPQAKIIDVRRHPLASGWSLYKHFFAEGFEFSYNLESIGHYYNDYLALMNHWQQVLPQQILSINYEDLVQDLPGITAKILAYCELPFEENCLAFHQNKRAVATASSEQVRKPLYTSALEHWKNYDTFLAPLAQVINP